VKKAIYPLIVVAVMAVMMLAVMGSASAHTPRYTITASAGTGGTISPSGNVRVYRGASQTFKIAAKSGYKISSVVVDGSSVGAVASYTFTNVRRDHTVRAKFAVAVTPPSVYTIIASAGANGTISPSGNVSVNGGSSQQFVMAGATGYQVADVLVDGVSVGAVTSYTFSNISANHTIAATFAASVTPPPPVNTYPKHTVMSTYFWVGEPADADNFYISNTQSAWDDAWQQHYGGVDDPAHRNGYLPAGFTPKENPFYCALPYNDFGENGNRRSNVTSIYWWGTKTWGPLESACKNQWIAVTYNGKTCYCQWEDVGPEGENDVNYVFGTAKPLNTTNQNNGFDVSPAVHDYLGMGDMTIITWQFVDASQVPDGPWKNIITTSQIYWP
jgi:Divergent InlB B-repeat domain